VCYFKFFSLLFFWPTTAQKWTPDLADTYCTPQQIEHVKLILREIAKEIKDLEIRKSTEMADVGEDELCSICYAEKMTTRFQPCDHT